MLIKLLKFFYAPYLLITILLIWRYLLSVWYSCYVIMEDICMAIWTIFILGLVVIIILL